LRIRWTELAAEDLDSIAAYIESDNQSAATRQILLIINAVERLLPKNPSIGRPGRVHNTKELIIPKTPYIVAYRVKQNEVQVLRVLHGARRWPSEF
jgi:addiction module RelE/StbE family toxin